jgi:uncharacterized protein (UPF0276 family)
LQQDRWRESEVGLIATRLLSARAARITAERSSVPREAGIGLRFPHHQAVLDERPRVAWLEVHTENYLGGGTPLAYLEAIRRDYPIALHGVGLSLGSAEGLDLGHLARIRQTVERIAPALVSEHLSWSIAEGCYLADLLPLPMTEEARHRLPPCRSDADRSQALHPRREPVFLSVLAALDDPRMGFSRRGSSPHRLRHPMRRQQHLCEGVQPRLEPSIYLAALPPSAISEIHLAGHSVRQFEGGRTLRVDDHGSRVIPGVWELYAEALARFGPVPTLIEWDTNVPALAVLVDEATRAAALLDCARQKIADADAA